MLTIGRARIELCLGDITQQDTEAIGNAANAKLAGGGGVDGATHSAGGPSLMAQLKARYPEGCPTGQAVITGGGRLKATFVIHAVGPVYAGKPHDATLLASAYRSSLEICSRHGITSVAFPSISTGAYGYPVQEAAPIRGGARTRVQASPCRPIENPPSRETSSSAWSSGASLSERVIAA